MRFGWGGGRKLTLALDESEMEQLSRLMTRLWAGKCNNCGYNAGTGERFLTSPERDDRIWAATVSHSVGTGSCLLGTKWPGPELKLRTYLHLVPKLRMELFLKSHVCLYSMDRVFNFIDTKGS
jgi:hypothetical protein